MSKRLHDVWSDPDADRIALLPSDRVDEDVARGLLSSDATLLFRFEASCSEEAAAIRDLRLGWEPYRPSGEAAPCPECGAMYWPEGSGECWRCDQVLWRLPGAATWQAVAADLLTLSGCRS